MAIIGGSICTGASSPTTIWMWSPARSIGVVSSQPTVGSLGPSWPGSRGRVRWPSPWRLHRLALRGGGAGAGRHRGPAGRAGGDGCQTRPKAPRQDRPVRRPPSRGSRRCRCLRPGRGCGCIRTWRRSARRGCSGSRPPCTTRACRSSPRSPAPLARPASLRPSCLPPASRPFRWACGSWIGSPPSWTRCAPTWPASPAASRAAGRCGPRTLGSARSPRWRSGPRWATPAASRPPMTPCATPAWTSPSTLPTPSGPGPPRPARAGHAALGAV